MNTLSKTFNKNLRFGDWAVKLKFMTPEQLDKALLKQGSITNQRVGNILVQEKLIDNEQKAEILAKLFSYEYVKPDIKINTDLFNLLPLNFMIKNLVIPYKKNGDTLRVAMGDPLNFFSVADKLEIFTGLDISIAIASEDRIAEIIKLLESSASMLDEVSGDMRLSLINEKDKGENILNLEKVSSEESQIVKLIDSTILDAINKQASDIHFETSDIGVIIRYRIDGMLFQATDPLDIQHYSQIISRIKVMSELDISEKRIPQDGRFKLMISGRYVDFRVSILPTIFGEDAVIRILDQEKLLSNAQDFNLETLGLLDDEQNIIKRMINAPYGMFLMTGPTGSGKTTTLYMALSEVNHKNVKIITIEDPVEYQLEGIVQVPVNEKKGLTFARGLRSILRHDPDKILIGEIRDTETAEIALQSALTGHLVFTTVHANSSFEVINRFVHMGIEPYNLMAALNCIVAQRLIRTLCNCKVKTVLSATMLEESGISPAEFSGYQTYKENGCSECNGTGFKGRKAIIEIVELNDAIKELFVQNASIRMLKKMAADSGTTFLRKAAIREVLNGVTTLDEANRVTFIEN